MKREKKKTVSYWNDLLELADFRFRSVESADQAIYLAKKSGKNRVES